MMTPEIMFKSFRKKVRMFCYRALFKDAEGEVLRSTWKGKLELILTRDSMIHKENTSDIFIFILSSEKLFNGMIPQHNNLQQMSLLMLFRNVIMIPHTGYGITRARIFLDARCETN